MPNVAVRTFLLQVILGAYVSFKSIEGIEHYMLTVSLILILLLKELDDNEYFDDIQFFKPSEPVASKSAEESSPRSMMSSLPSITSVFQSQPTTFAPPAFSQFPTTNLALKKLQACFPGAMRNKDIVRRVTATLKKYSYGRSSLLATSLCCDEVNRDLEKEFINAYGDNFSMGGLAGFAFGGVTSFGAMAHHIPQDGSCLIIYGPHVGIDSNGTVGKINRRGREVSGACCGSAAAAAGYVSSVRRGAPKSPMPKRALDAQQYFVGSMLLPHAERLARAEETHVELPHALYDVQSELMLKIVLNGCKEVAGEGKIALLGGIQINTPSGVSDYFLPKKFEIRNNKGQLLENFLFG